MLYSGLLKISRHSTCARTIALGVLLAVAPFALTDPAWAGIITISAEQQQSGFIGYVPAPLYSSDVYAPPITALPFDFTGTDYTSLRTIDSISLELTIGSGDTGPGDDGIDDLSLRLNGIETGIKLNGFPFWQVATNTVEGAPADAAAIVSQILATGQLQPTLFDRCCAFGDSRKYIVIAIPSVDYKWLVDWAWQRAADPNNPLTTPDALLAFTSELAGELQSRGSTITTEQLGTLVNQLFTDLPASQRGINDADIMGVLGLPGTPVHARITITGTDNPEPATLVTMLGGILAVAVFRLRQRHRRT